VSSATFACTAAQEGEVIFNRMAAGRHRGSLHVSGAEGWERFCPDTTIEQIRSRLRCSCRSRRGIRIVMEVWTPSGAPSGGFER
jgi:hypothetical protein